MARLSLPPSPSSRRLFSLLFHCLSSLSLSLSLSPCDVALVLCLVCVGRERGGGGDRVFVQNTLRVSIQNVPVCTGTTRACCNTCARGAGTDGDVLNRDTEGFTPHRNTTQHNTTQHNTTRNNTTQHNTRHHTETGRDRDRERRQKEDETR